MNIYGFYSNFVECESFLESNIPDILALCKTNLDDSIDSGNFSVKVFCPLILKDCATHMHDLAVYLKEGLPFAQDLSLKNSGFTSLDWLYFTQCLTSFSYLSPSLSLCTVFDTIWSNIDDVLLIDPSANVLVFGDFNAHHKVWLTFSGGTDRPGELYYNFTISNFLFFLSFLSLSPQCFWTDRQKFFRECSKISYQRDMCPRSDSFLGYNKKYFCKNCFSSFSIQGSTRNGQKLGNKLAS